MKDANINTLTTLTKSKIDFLDTKHSKPYKDIVTSGNYFYENKFVCSISLLRNNPVSDYSVFSKFKEKELKENQYVLGMWNDNIIEPPLEIIKLAEEVSKAFKTGLPELYEKHVSKLSDTTPVLGDSVFTTVVLNDNFEAGIHKDGNIYPDTLEAIITFKKGPSLGGWLNFNDFNFTVVNNNNTLIILDGVNHYHSVTEKPEGQDRKTLLFSIHKDIHEYR